MEFRNRTVVVTGAASGIGKGVAEAITAAGGRVLALDREHVPSSAAVDSHQVDLADIAALRTVCDALLDVADGRIGAVVNAAGFGRSDRISDITCEQWDTVHHVNLRAPLFIIQALLPGLVADAPSAVVNVSSLAGRSYSVWGSTAYTASKAGLLGLTRHLAAELGPQGVRVNAVCPGPTLTPATTAYFTDAERTRLEDLAPLRQVGQIPHQVDAILYLAGPRSSHVTGVSLDVNGGLLMA